MSSVLILIFALVICGVWRVWLRLSIRADEDSWLPLQLRDADLKYTEKNFFAAHPLPMIARVDRAYLTPAKNIVLADYKRRNVKRAFASDIVELSAQRVAMLANGIENMSSSAFVVIVDPVTGKRTPIEVTLENEKTIYRRQRRYIGIREGSVNPAGAAHVAICNRCGHHDYCPDKLWQ